MNVKGGKVERKVDSDYWDMFCAIEVLNALYKPIAKLYRHRDLSFYKYNIVQNKNHNEKER